MQGGGGSNLFFHNLNNGINDQNNSNLVRNKGHFVDELGGGNAILDIERSKALRQQLVQQVNGGGGGRFKGNG